MALSALLLTLASGIAMVTSFSLKMTFKSTGDVESKLNRFRERFQTHPKLSSLIRSDVTQYGICTALAKKKLQEGSIDDAKNSAKEAIALSEKTHEEASVYTAYARGILGDAVFAQKNFKEASELYAEGLKAYEEHFKGSTSPDALELLGAAQLLITDRLSEQDYNEAVSLSRFALKETARIFGSSSVEVAGALINLAVSLMHAGDLRDSTELKIKRAQALFKGKDPSGYLQSTCVLGQYYLFRGDLFKADEVLNSAAIEAGLIPSTERVDVTGYLMRENTEFIEDEMD